MNLKKRDDIRSRAMQPSSLLARFRSLLDELDIYIVYMREIKSRLDSIDEDYREKKFGFKEYESLQEQVLRGKSRKQLLSEYGDYISYLLSALDLANQQISGIFYNMSQPKAKSGAHHLYASKLDHSKESSSPMDAGSDNLSIMVKDVALRSFPKHPVKSAVGTKAPSSSPLPKQITGIKSVLSDEKDREGGSQEKLADPEPSLFRVFYLYLKKVFSRSSSKSSENLMVLSNAKQSNASKVSSASSYVVKNQDTADKKPTGAFKGMIPDFLRNKKVQVAQTKLPSPKGLAQSAGASGVTPKHGLSLKERMLAFVQGKPVAGLKLGSESRVPGNYMVNSEKGESNKTKSERSKVARFILAEEASNIRNLLKKDETYRPYKPSQIGQIANASVKKMGLWLMARFPGFFKFLYNALRLSGLPILSNTYINIMIFATVAAFLVGSSVFITYFILVGDPLILFVSKGFLMGVVFALAIFAFFYGYPFFKLKYKLRSINTNLAFAINHMAAISSAGVPPVEVFRLLVESKEYGAVTQEAKRIVDLTDLFGYDLITAIRSVAVSTPSPAFKDFLEGIVSAVESGADLKEYLSQKSTESLLSYKLERQRYTEMISTYSDIYTGILIAAPLFFIITMSLVNILGGNLGNISITNLMVYVTYLGIPCLNALFIVFLEVSQPDV